MRHPAFEPASRQVHADKDIRSDPSSDWDGNLADSRFFAGDWPESDETHWLAAVTGAMFAILNSP